MKMQCEPARSCWKGNTLDAMSRIELAKTGKSENSILWLLHFWSMQSSATLCYKTH